MRSIKVTLEGIVYPVVIPGKDKIFLVRPYVLDDRTLTEKARDLAVEYLTAPVRVPLQIAGKVMVPELMNSRHYSKLREHNGYLEAVGK